MKTEASQTWQLHALLKDMNSACQAERANRLTSLLVCRESHLALEFALFLERNFPIEVLVRCIQITQCLLHGTLRHLIHPGEICLLESIEFFVQRHS